MLEFLNLSVFACCTNVVMVRIVAVGCFSGRHLAMALVATISVIILAKLSTAQSNFNSVDWAEITLISTVYQPLQVEFYLCKRLRMYNQSK